MGKISSPLPGNIRGKVGNKVYYVRKGKQYVRAVSQKVNSAPTEALLAQQRKMKIATYFAGSLKQLVAISYRGYKKHISPFNDFVKQFLHTGITGSYPNFAIDYSKVSVSRGILFGTSTAQVKAVHRELHFTWNATCWHGANKNDNVILVAYCESLNQCLFNISGPNRCAGEATLPVPDFRRQSVHVWIGFISADCKEVADSKYLGMIRVT